MPSITAATQSPAARRALWTLTSQGLSSITNFVTSLLVARVCTDDEYGRFALAFSFYGLAVGFTKSVAAMPFAMRKGTSEQDTRARGAAAATTALLLGLVVSVLYVAGAFAFGGRYRDALVAVGIFLSLMCAQETWRSVFVSEQRPHVAALLDLVWLLLEIPAFWFVLHQGYYHAVPMVVAWALPGALAGLVGWLSWRSFAGPRAAVAYVRGDRDLWGFQALEYIAVMGSNQLALTAVAGLGEERHVGALRGALTLLAPVTILSQGVGSFVLAEITRRDLNENGRAIRWADGLSAFLGVFALVWGGLLLLVPDAWGVAVLGATWAGASAVLLPMSLQMLGLGLAQGPMVLMFSRSDSRAVFQVSVVTAVLILGCVVVGEWRYGMVGAAWGYAVANLGVVPLWFWRARRHSAAR